MSSAASHSAATIFRAATPVLRIDGLGGRKWKRNVAGGARVGPWLPAQYEILDPACWGRRAPCLYLVAGDDLIIRYVGISRNRMKDRWRVSPALDAETMERLPRNQLFHSQCWRHIEREYADEPGNKYEVRCIAATALAPVLAALGPPLSAFLALGGDEEGLVAGVERWLCNHRGPSLVPWNVAMTA